MKNKNCGDLTMFDFLKKDTDGRLDNIEKKVKKLEGDTTSELVLDYYNTLIDEIIEIQKEIAKQNKLLNSVVEKLNENEKNNNASKIMLMKAIQGLYKINNEDADKNKNDVDIVSINELIPKSYRYSYKSNFKVNPNGTLQGEGKGNGRLKLTIFDILEVEDICKVYGNLNNIKGKNILGEYVKNSNMSEGVFYKIAYNYINGKFDNVIKEWNNLLKQDAHIDTNESLEKGHIALSNGEMVDVDIYTANVWRANYMNNNSPADYLVKLQKRNLKIPFYAINQICKTWEIYENNIEIKPVNNPQKRKEIGLN